MIQECSLLRVLEIFFQEPNTIHFIREISKRINLAPTSVKNHILTLKNLNLIKEKSSKPFDGYISNRDNELFLHYKRSYNLYSLYSLKEKIIQSIYPSLFVVFGSYSKGEDVETSDIDILIISKTHKEINLSLEEKQLKRKINIMILDNFNKLEKNIQKKAMNGIVLSGSF